MNYNYQQNTYQNTNFQQQNFMNQTNRNNARTNKKRLLNTNDIELRTGRFKNYFCKNSIIFRHDKTFKSSKIISLPDIRLFYDSPINILDKIGHKSNIRAGINNIPAIMLVVGEDFEGSNVHSCEEINDISIVVRTNYPQQIKNQHVAFRETKDNDYRNIIYTPYVATIRDSNMNLTNPNNLSRYSVITVIQQELDNIKMNDEEYYNNSDDDEQEYYLTADNLTLFKKKIEAVFQSAIYGRNNILLLTIFPEDYNIPYEDQILIYNYCLTKYSHKFEMVGIAIDPKTEREIFEFFKESIINPSYISKKIDMKYEELVMKANIDNDSTIDSDNDSESEQLSNSEYSNSIKKTSKKTGKKKRKFKVKRK
jgi:hypothetical protein